MIQKGRKTSNTLYCFSPPVMILTCVIELSLLIYTIWRYKFNSLTRLTVVMLSFLAAFQLAEFQVCTGHQGTVQWSHFGFIAITLLPAVGIHAITLLGNSGKHRIRLGQWLVWAAYSSAVAFVAYFALTVNSLQNHQCLGNYVIFQINPHLTWLYSFYYYGWITIGMALSYQYGEHAKQPRIKQALYGFTLGYVVFLVPTTTVNLLNHTTTSGIPSIMCGFAVLFAIVLVTYIMPRVGKIKSSSIKRHK